MNKILLILFLACGVMGAQWETVVAGDINDGATFGNTSPGVEGPDYPDLDAGDTVTVDAPDTLTIPDGVAFAGVVKMDSALTSKYNELRVYGTFTLAANCTLRGYNNVHMYSGSTLNLNAFDIILWGETNAHYYNYRFIGSAGDSVSVYSASISDRARLSSPTSSLSRAKGIADFKYCKFKNVDTSYFYPSDAGQYANVTNCRFDSCGLFTFTNYTSSDSVVVSNCVFTNMMGTYPLELTALTTGSPGGKKRLVSNNRFYNGWVYDASPPIIRMLNCVEYTIKNNSFVNTKIQMNSSASTIDTCFFFSVQDFAPVSTVVQNSVVYTGHNNPHHFAGNVTLRYSYVEDNYDALVQSPINDKGDMTTLQSTGTMIVQNNIINGSHEWYGSGCVLLIIGGTMNGNATLSNNTWVNYPKNHGFVRSEGTGIGGSGTIKIYNNLFYHRAFTDTGYIINLGVSADPDQIDSIDYNGVYQYNNVPFVNLSITDRDSGDVWMNSVLIKQNPGFSDHNWGLKYFVYGKGYDSTSEGVALAFNDSITFISQALAAARLAYTPSNEAYDSTGYAGSDIGAVEFTAATSPTITVQPVDDTVIVGGTATFTITATGASSYVVYRNSDSVGNSDSYSFAAAIEDDGDSVWWKCSNGDGDTYSDTAFLTVNPIPTIGSIKISKINVVGTFENASGKTATMRGEFATVTAQTGTTMSITLPALISTGDIDTLKIEDFTDSCWYQIKYTYSTTKLLLQLKMVASSGITIDSIGIVQFSLYHTGTVDSVHADGSLATSEEAGSDSVLVTPASPMMWRRTAYPIVLSSGGGSIPYSYYLKHAIDARSQFATSIQTGMGL